MTEIYLTIDTQHDCVLYHLHFLIKFRIYGADVITWLLLKYLKSSINN